MDNKIFYFYFYSKIYFIIWIIYIYMVIWRKKQLHLNM